MRRFGDTPKRGRAVFYYLSPIRVGALGGQHSLGLYDFSRDLPARRGRCAFRVREELTSLAEKDLEWGKRVFLSLPADPRSSRIFPMDRSRRIQAFVLFLDAEATDASMLEHVSFTIRRAPRARRYPVLNGAAREAILKTLSPEQRTGPWRLRSSAETT